METMAVWLRDSFYCLFSRLWTRHSPVDASFASIWLIFPPSSVTPQPQRHVFLAELDRCFVGSFTNAWRWAIYKSGQWCDVPVWSFTLSHFFPYLSLVIQGTRAFNFKLCGYTNNVPTWAWTRFIKLCVCIIPHQYNTYTVNRCEHITCTFRHQSVELFALNTICVLLSKADSPSLHTRMCYESNSKCWFSMFEPMACSCFVLQGILLWKGSFEQ